MVQNCCFYVYLSWKEVVKVPSSQSKFKIKGLARCLDKPRRLKVGVFQSFKSAIANIMHSNEKCMECLEPKLGIQICTAATTLVPAKCQNSGDSTLAWLHNLY